jgi:hypothetical protein
MGWWFGLAPATMEFGFDSQTRPPRVPCNRSSCIGLSNCTNLIELRAFMLWATVVQVALNIVKSESPAALGSLQICMETYD